ncbi:MAG TPA: hypothetical protein VE615_09685 [Gaiellaceae bacterium]|nr:hypothetical protein [Gaiellaceae bacterium]
MVVSARQASVTKQRAVDAGAQAYVEKPIDNEELLGAVRAALGEGN